MFKIDVEGFEPIVLSGMQRVLHECKQVVGFIEFNSLFLEKLNINVDEYLAKISQRFKVYLPVGETLVKLSKVTLEEIRKICGEKDIIEDLVFFVDDSEVSRFGIEIKTA